MINIAILGFGVVGSGVAELLTQNRDVIEKTTGERVSLKYVVDIREFPESPFKDLVVHDFAVVERDPEVSVVIETIGGARVAYDFTRRALAAGKSVVTSNKELVATHGPELLALAEEKGCTYLFEAAVGGGIPVLKPMVTELGHNRIKAVSGILNGTTNYILTRMFRGGVDFATALKEAQANGYAEADPTADIEGHDACRKIAILAAIAFGEMVPTEKIHTEGITAIRGEDVKAASSIGASVKLLGRAIGTDAGVYVLVAPFVVGADFALAHINDVYNGVSVLGDFVGDVMFYGRGAGSYPTASAVVSDVCALLARRAPKYVFGEDDSILADFATFSSGRYLALTGVGKGEISRVFGEVKYLDGAAGECAFIAEEMTEAVLEEKLDAIKSAGATVLSSIRVMG